MWHADRPAGARQQIENGPDAAFAAIGFLLTECPGLLAPRALVELFAGFAEQGRPGGLMKRPVHLPIGMIVAAFHPVWSGPGCVCLP